MKFFAYAAKLWGTVLLVGAVAGAPVWVPAVIWGRTGAIVGGAVMAVAILGLITYMFFEDEQQSVPPEEES